MRPPRAVNGLWLVDRIEGIDGIVQFESFDSTDSAGVLKKIGDVTLSCCCHAAYCGMLLITVTVQLALGMEPASTGVVLCPNSHISLWIPREKRAAAQSKPQPGAAVAKDARHGLFPRRSEQPAGRGAAKPARARNKKAAKSMGQTKIEIKLPKFLTKVKRRIFMTLTRQRRWWTQDCRCCVPACVAAADHVTSGGLGRDVRIGGERQHFLGVVAELSQDR